MPRGRPKGGGTPGGATQYIATTNDLGVDQALTAIIAYPTLEMAREYLKEHGYEADIKKLKAWRDVRFADRFQELRKEISPKIEAMLADDMLSNARLASEVEGIAIQHTKTMLEKGEVQDPSRVARDLSQVRSQAIDKRLALEGRPTKITETRNVEEVVRALEGLGVVKAVDATVVED